MSIVPKIRWDAIRDGKPAPVHPERPAWREAGAEVAERAQAVLPAGNRRIEKTVAIVLHGGWSLFIGLAFCLTAAQGATQPAQLADLPQFPELMSNRPFQRWWWAFQDRTYPLGEVPAEARQQALEQIAQSKTDVLLTSQAVSVARWVNIGPDPILGGQIGSTGNARPVSGRIADIAVDPQDAAHWLIGAAQGGIWETRDAGTTWVPKTDDQASLAIGAIAFAPSNASIVYAGTGEAVFASDAYAGAGLLKSTDGGVTWTLLAAATFAGTGCSTLKVHPTDPKVVLAATVSGIAGLVYTSPPSMPPRGIFKTTDGGVTWQHKLTGEAADLAVAPNSFSNQYAGIGGPFGDPTNGVYRSIDNGETWTLIHGPWETLPGGVGRVALAIAPSKPQVLYVSIQDRFDSPSQLNDGGLLGLFRTDNAWDPTPTWIPIPTDATGAHGYCGTQCWYNHKIVVEPTDANTLYAGGISLWKCTNCGASPLWTNISNTVTDALGPDDDSDDEDKDIELADVLDVGDDLAVADSLPTDSGNDSTNPSSSNDSSNPSNGIHVDQHAMVWAGNRLIVGNDGGVWSTTDGGTTWMDHNTSLAITQFYHGSVHPTQPNFVLAGSQDNGLEKWTGTDAWQWLFGGDGVASAISASRPETDWAITLQNLRIRRTTDGGASFTIADLGIDKTNVPFIARLEKCPANDNTFIAGTDNVWRCDNFFRSTFPTWTDNGSGNFTSGISGLAFAPSDLACNTYGFGSRAGSLRLTSNGGTSWVDIDASNVVPNRAVTHLAFDPRDANVLYVTLSGFDEGTPGQPGHVFKTTNALTPSPTWTNISPPVNIPHNAIVLDPNNPDVVYIGTDLGVWQSTDGGGSWSHMGPETGMPNVAVFDLKMNATTYTVFAFTHGRGAFMLASDPPPPPVQTQVSVSNSSSSGGGGCTLSPGTACDPTLIGLLGLMLACLSWTACTGGRKQS